VGAQQNASFLFMNFSGVAAGIERKPALSTLYCVCWVRKRPKEATAALQTQQRASEAVVIARPQ
jgi:hypothetical protein